MSGDESLRQRKFLTWRGLCCPELLVNYTSFPPLPRFVAGLRRGVEALCTRSGGLSRSDLCPGFPFLGSFTTPSEALRRSLCRLRVHGQRLRDRLLIRPGRKVGLHLGGQRFLRWFLDI